ncbi:cation-translocating P-type ATPase [Candidatus Daviesbacteria bacterium]|nr:cation-translocating P-type ATPase [Candidatus Daviesbacteria bacterium]
MILGLTSAKAQEALIKYGLNTLPQKNRISAFKVFLRQIKNPFAFLLFGAVVLSLVVGDFIDVFLIAAILLLNIVLGFWQEYKASKELEALKKFEVEFARVLRDGKEVEIQSTHLVPEDVVILESGDKVPADGQIIESYLLQVNESVLTGESLPVAKTSKQSENLVFFGTTVVSGRAKILVTQTGLKTKFGTIAQDLTQIEDEQTPLEKALETLSRGIGIGALGISAVVFALRVFQGFEITQVLLGSIALMVAIVPEGLPTVLTLVLALGVRRMYHKKALVRKMIAVESLGAATVIVTDKTGTLTKNEMRVKEVSIKDRKENELLKCAVLCNSASLVLKEDGGSFDILGDTTEGALLLWAKDKGLDIDLERAEGKLVEEIPFDLKSRKMTVVWQEGSQKTAFTKGAPEVLIADCRLSEKEKEKWDLEYQKMAKKGLRTLAFSKDGQFLGLAGIADEVRPEAKEAIRVAKDAGIEVIMVTGDNELTAKAIGEDLGLLKLGDEVLTGVQLQELSDEQLQKRINKVKIFARITPQEKLRIVQTLQRLGEVVAVTGDGVNDVLALKQAEVGVSMGKIGTDVSKEASDIILLDDNFATLVTAIEQGRLIYSNILKVVKFLLTGNLSETLLIVFAVVLGFPTPLLPAQILWINFVTDGLPALSLGFDSPSKHVMKNPPRKDSNLLGPNMLRYVIAVGGIIAVFCLGIFYYLLSNFGLQTARNATFTAMVVFQMTLPFIIRRHHSILSNKKLFASVVFVLVMQLLILTYPPLQMLFKI